MYLQANYTSIAQKIKNLELAKETCTSSAEVAYLLRYFDTSKFNHHRFKDDLHIKACSLGN